MNLKDLLSYSLDKLKKLGIDKAYGTINDGEKKELNIESGKISLLRTTFQSSLNLEGIKDNKQSSEQIKKSKATINSTQNEKNSSNPNS